VKKRLLILAIGLLHPVLPSVAAEPVTSLPEPLTLEAALDAIDPSHPLIAASQARRQLANAAEKRVRAADDATLDLALEARRVEPIDTAPNQDRDDSRARLTLYKTLYDFGRTANRTAAANHAVASSESGVALAMMEIRRQVMQRYFDVILADLDAATANEAMSVAFVGYDHARDRHELGEISDVELLQQENAYQSRLIERQQAEARQRATRSQLALILNRPESLASSLENPALPGIRKPLPDYDALVEEVRQGNAQLRALQADLAAIQSQQDAVRAERRPTLYLQLEAAEYQREFGSRDPLTAILGLNVPLYQGGRIDADLSEQDALAWQLKSDYRAAEYRLRQELLELYQTIEILLQQLKQADIRQDYRDLSLDRSRAEYDLELRTDLGDAMVQQTAARLFSRQIAFELALAREKLVILTGNPGYSALAPASEETP